VLAELIAGSLAGSLHALSGPDHVAALAPLSAEQPNSALSIGVRWGIGHGIGMATVGGLALVLREVIPLEAVEGFGEPIVGAVLIGIGLACVYRALRTRLHAHAHEHEGVEHVHVHVHARADAHAADSRPHFHSHTSLAVGALHGVAGGPHLFALLPLLALSVPWGTACYLLGFTLGALLAMGLMARAMGALSGLALRRSASAYRYVLCAAGMVSVGVGGYWIARGA
jgi:hypothetical protein